MSYYCSAGVYFGYCEARKYTFKKEPSEVTNFELVDQMPWPRREYGEERLVSFREYIRRHADEYGKLGDDHDTDSKAAATRICRLAVCWGERNLPPDKLELKRLRDVTRIYCTLFDLYPEGTRCAEATATAIYLASSNISKQELVANIWETYGLKPKRMSERSRPGYPLEGTGKRIFCEALAALIDGESFYDVIEKADYNDNDACDRMMIAGSLAEAFYGLPEDWEKCLKVVIVYFTYEETPFNCGKNSTL